MTEIEKKPLFFKRLENHMQHMWNAKVCEVGTIPTERSPETVADLWPKGVRFEYILRSLSLNEPAVVTFVR